MWLHELHIQYGAVVRYSPNELSFIEPETWKDIYAHKTTPLFQKDYKLYGTDSFGNPPGLLRANDISHARQRKLVSHAFSDKALHEQQHLLMHYVKLLVHKLKEASKYDAQSKVNIVDWYNFTTFDIMADLTFGEPLKMLEDSAYTPWVQSLLGNMRIIQIGSCIRHWPGLEKLMFLLLPKKRVEQKKFHIQHSITRVDKRMALKTDRPDIWTYIMRHSESEENKGKGLTQTEMYSNAALFMLAGTETTATELSGLTYYLLKNPQKMERLQKEVRGAFESPEEMTMTALGQMPYLGACIEEGLRLYPPVPGALPRVTPREGAMVRGQWLPGGVSNPMCHICAFIKRLIKR
jgi:cytochrome P450